MTALPQPPVLFLVKRVPVQLAQDAGGGTLPEVRTRSLPQFPYCVHSDQNKTKPLDTTPLEDEKGERPPPPTPGRAHAGGHSDVVLGPLSPAEGLRGRGCAGGGWGGWRPLPCDQDEVGAPRA